MESSVISKVFGGKRPFDPLKLSAGEDESQDEKEGSSSYQEGKTLQKDSDNVDQIPKECKVFVYMMCIIAKCLEASDIF